MSTPRPGDGTQRSDRSVSLHPVGDGRTLAAEHIEVLRITGGRVAEFWSTSLDPYTEDEFWS